MTPQGSRQPARAGGAFRQRRRQRADERTCDFQWGRSPGDRPPLRPIAPLLFAAVGGVLLAAVVLLLVHTAGPLDESTLADQRSGLLRDTPTVPPLVAGVRFGTAPVVLLFVRQAPAPRDVRRWSAGLPSYARVRVVVQAPTPEPAPPPGPEARTGTINDPQGLLARAVVLPSPRDGGPGVGYAVVDVYRHVRYSTLDPSWRGNSFEVATITGAL